MKKISSFAIFSLLLLSFSGCSSTKNTDSSDSHESSSSISSSNLAEVAAEISDDSSETTDELFVDGPLTSPGQWTSGSVLHADKTTLLKISDEKITQEIIPGLKMTIDSVKLMKNEGLSEDFYDMMGIDSSYIIDDSFYTIQVSYTVSNDTDIVQDFNGIEYITTSAREQVEVSFNNLSGVEMTFQPAVDVPGNTVLSVLSPEGAADITSVNLAFWTLYPEGYDDLVRPPSIEITF